MAPNSQWLASIGQKPGCSGIQSKLHSVATVFELMVCCVGRAQEVAKNGLSNFR